MTRELEIDSHDGRWTFIIQYDTETGEADIVKRINNK